MSSNVYADRGRLAKVLKLLGPIPLGNDAAANGRCADVLAGYSKADRKRFAAGLDVREPSDETWARLVDAVRNRPALDDLRKGSNMAERYCTYCTEVAKGLDDDGEFTCDSELCAPIAAPLPRVAEVSDDEEREDEEL